MSEFNRREYQTVILSLLHRVGKEWLLGWESIRVMISNNTLATYD